MENIQSYEAMAMLELSDDERELLSARFEKITDGFSALDAIDTAGALPLVSVLSLNNVMREDVCKKDFTRDEILSNAPEQYDGYFQVPGTLE